MIYRPNDDIYFKILLYLNTNLTNLFKNRVRDTRHIYLKKGYIKGGTNRSNTRMGQLLYEDATITLSNVFKSMQFMLIYKIVKIQKIFIHYLYK